MVVCPPKGKCSDIGWREDGSDPSRNLDPPQKTVYRTGSKYYAHAQLPGYDQGMNNHTSLSLLDEWLLHHWTSTPDEYHWLVLQTIATATSRRQWIETWPAVNDGLFFDLGTGPGITALEIATLKSCRVIGYDKDARVLDLAQSIQRLFAEQDQVRFRLGDILDDFHDEPADGVCVRFVAQYAENLVGFLSRVKQRVKPGGYIAIEDIDDGYLVEYPEPPNAWKNAISAFQRFQSGRLGDRYVGRKLAEAGLQAGLIVADLSVNPSVQAGITNRDDISVEFDINRLEQSLPAMIQAGLITETEWYDARAQYRASFPHYTFISNATIRLLLRLP